jgi:hypothetical protein
METTLQNYLNYLCCSAPSNCSSEFATKQLNSLGDLLLVNGYNDSTTCSDATINLLSIGDLSQVYLYPTALNGATVELLSIGNVSLGFGY